MRNIEVPLQVIDKLLPENDKILFNLFYRIAELQTVFWVSNDKSYIIGQTNDNCLCGFGSAKRQTRWQWQR